MLTAIQLTECNADTAQKLAFWVNTTIELKKIQCIQKVAVHLGNGIVMAHARLLN